MKFHRFLSGEGSQGLAKGFDGGSTRILVPTTCEETNTILRLCNRFFNPLTNIFSFPPPGYSVTSAASAVSAASLDYWLGDHCKAATLRRSFVLKI